MAKKAKKRQEDELDDELFAQITEICERGNLAFDDDRFDEAIEEYGRALAVLPPPLERWEASTWVLTALGDCHYLKEEYPEALGYLARAVRCEGGLGNPFIHLRLGQVHFELGNEDRAKNELARAYMGDGPEIFEDQDPKYLTFLRRFMIGI
jgi:tetratricopeptide (TPR) repeat protein